MNQKTKWYVLMGLVAFIGAYAYVAPHVSVAISRIVVALWALGVLVVALIKRKE